MTHGLLNKVQHVAVQPLTVIIAYYLIDLHGNIHDMDGHQMVFSFALLMLPRWMHGVILACQID